MSSDCTLGPLLGTFWAAVVSTKRAWLLTTCLWTFFSPASCLLATLGLVLTMWCDLKVISENVRREWSADFLIPKVINQEATCTWRYLLIAWVFCTHGSLQKKWLAETAVAWVRNERCFSNITLPQRKKFGNRMNIEQALFVNGTDGGTCCCPMSTAHNLLCRVTYRRSYKKFLDIFKNTQKFVKVSLQYMTWKCSALLFSHINVFHKVGTLGTQSTPKKEISRK